MPLHDVSLVTTAATELDPVYVSGLDAPVTPTNKSSQTVLKGVKEKYSNEIFPSQFTFLQAIAQLNDSQTIEEHRNTKRKLRNRRSKCM